MEAEAVEQAARQALQLVEDVEQPPQAWRRQLVP
jgi:hypothetical protein